MRRSRQGRRYNHPGESKVAFVRLLARVAAAVVGAAPWWLADRRIGAAWEAGGMSWVLAGLCGFVGGIVTPGLSQRFTRWLNRFPRLGGDALYMLLCLGDRTDKSLMRLHSYLVPTRDDWFGMLRAEDLSAAPAFSQIPLLTYSDLAMRFQLATEELERAGCCRVEDRGQGIAFVALTAVGEVRYQREQGRRATLRRVERIRAALRARRIAVTARFLAAKRPPGLSGAIGAAIEQLERETGECRTVVVPSV